MKIIIIPDIHGRTFWKRIVNEKFDKVIFLGDYVDPYPNENITEEDAIENFKEIIKFKNANPNKVELLLGNHDCSYMIYPTICECRISVNHFYDIQNLFRDNYSSFKLVHKEVINNKEYVFSHAGIRSIWFDTLKDIKCVEDINTIIDNFFTHNNELNPNVKALSDVSFYRFGDKMTGSIVWADIREQPIAKRFGIQIFGHTQIIRPYFEEHFACLDVRRPFILEDNVLKEFNNDIIKDFTNEKQCNEN